MLNNGGLVVAPSDSEHSDGMNKSSVNEPKEEDATALDVIERSTENFSLVSHLLIIACNHLKKFNDFVM
jgi:hypothetical protein